MGKLQSGDMRQAAFGVGALSDRLARDKCRESRGDQAVLRRLRTGENGEPVGSRAERRMMARELRRRNKNHD